MLFVCFIHLYHCFLPSMETVGGRCRILPSRLWPKSGQLCFSKVSNHILGLSRLLLLCEFGLVISMSLLYYGWGFVMVWSHHIFEDTYQKRSWGEISLLLHLVVIFVSLDIWTTSVWWALWALFYSDSNSIYGVRFREQYWESVSQPLGTCVMLWHRLLYYPKCYLTSVWSGWEF